MGRTKAGSTSPSGRVPLADHPQAQAHLGRAPQAEPPTPTPRLGRGETASQRHSGRLWEEAPEPCEGPGRGCALRQARGRTWLSTGRCFHLAG